MKIKRFSGYSESAPGGVSYRSSQVVSNYILDPIDRSIDYVDNTTLGHTSIVKKKSKRIKSMVGPLKKFFKGKDN